MSFTEHQPLVFVDALDVKFDVDNVDSTSFLLKLIKVDENLIEHDISHYVFDHATIMVPVEEIWNSGKNSCFGWKNGQFKKQQLKEVFKLFKFLQIRLSEFHYNKDLFEASKKILIIITDYNKVEVLDQEYFHEKLKSLTLKSNIKFNSNVIFEKRYFKNNELTKDTIIDYCNVINKWKN